MPQPSNPKTFAVVGATGQQGGAVAYALLEAGAQARALTRSIDSSSARRLADAGAQVVAADIDDPDSVQRAFDGVDGVFMMTTPYGPRGIEDEIRQGHVLADCAVAADVPLLLFSSVGGTERKTGIPHFDTKREVERYLESLDIPTVVIRPVAFMENLLGASIENDEVVVRFPLKDDIALQMISVVDIGRVAAALLIDPKRATGPVEIAGDELTGREIADAFGAYAHLPARYETVPTDKLEQHDRRAMFEWFNRPPAYLGDFEQTRRLDPDVLSFAAWIAQADWPAD